jgi:N utilization substance protein B
MSKSDYPARSAARLAAVQALYQMETSGAGVDAVVAEFIAHRLGADIEGDPIVEADADFFADIARGVVEAQRRIDPVIEQRLAQNWTLGRIDATARAILRAGVYELMRRADVPARATIDEYVELAKAFFDGDEPRFINALLDAVAHEARAEDFDKGAA